LVIKISKAALSALESIHCAGVLHGDISPENILICDSGIDFGHSKKCDDKRAKDEELTQLRDLLGLTGENQ
jgi:serine/threonine protein kinase